MTSRTQTTLSSEAPINIYPHIPSLIDVTSDELLFVLSEGSVTSLDLVNAYLARINDVNSALKVVMEFNPDVWAIARQLDVERAQGQLRGPLHGLPVLIKGNIGTQDRMETNAGSLALKGAVVPRDSTIVHKLRAQGLIILGKASLTEWSMFRSQQSSHGWNAICGETYGAYVPNQCPGGSSGGSAVTVDLGLTWASIGTETSGSIISPAERNNVVGIKPTVGLTSRYLIVPVSEHQDTVGPIARTVRDAARLLQVIAGPDDKDRYTSAAPHLDILPDYVAACKKNGLFGKRIGVARNVLYESCDEVLPMTAAFNRAVSMIADEGATIIEDANFTAFNEWKKREYNPVTRADFVTNLPQYLSQLEKNPQHILDVEDLRRFTHNCPEEEYPTRNTRNWDVAIGQGYDNASSEFHAKYQANLYFGGEGGVIGALERHELDAIVLPSAVAFEIPALVGTPIITVPLGAALGDTPIKRVHLGGPVEMAPGIPFGISFLGQKWSEEKLIEIAFAFEQKSLIRKTLRRHVEPRVDLVDIISLSTFRL